MSARLPELRIGRQSAGFLARGHPWIRPDRFTVGLAGLQAGQAVTLVDEAGRRLASALADPASAICARVYHRRADRAFDPAAALRAAWARRAGLHADPDTDCYRVVHGEADFLPGLRIERLGAVLVVEVRARCMLPHLAALLATLAGLLPEARIVIREHINDLRRRETSTRVHEGVIEPTEVVLGRELGVTVELHPFADLATGIYVDQRATRRWLRRTIAGKRVANLFAYTGLFSTSLLVAGAAEAIDIDLGTPALAIAAANARRNGVADRHRILRGDCRSCLQEIGTGWDLIIVDPPTAASGGGGWVSRRDDPPLLADCWHRLAPGGLLLACSNTSAGKGAVDPRRLLGGLPGAESLEPPRPDDDIPDLKGFPEGRPWRMGVARRAAQNNSSPSRQ